jgi:hypothetical protein
VVGLLHVYFWRLCMCIATYSQDFFRFDGHGCSCDRVLSWVLTLSRVFFLGCSLSQESSNTPAFHELYRIK